MLGDRESLRPTSLYPPRLSSVKTTEHGELNHPAMRSSPSCRPSHAVQLFDDLDSMADGTAAFLHEGLQDGGVLLAVVRSQQWDAIARRLVHRGVAVQSAIDQGDLTVCDAATTLSQFMRHGRPDPDLCRAAFGALVAGMISRGKGLWIYGEMADLLVAEGNFRAACQLETFGNGLSGPLPARVLCGYSAANFGHPRTATMLGQICQAHSDVRSDPNDPLSAFLVAEHGHSASVPHG